MRVNENGTRVNFRHASHVDRRSVSMLVTRGKLHRAADSIKFNIDNPTDKDRSGIYQCRIVSSSVVTLYEILSTIRFNSILYLCFPCVQTHTVVIFLFTFFILFFFIFNKPLRIVYFLLLQLIKHQWDNNIETLSFERDPKFALT